MRRIKLFLALLLIVQIIAVKWLANYPEIIEKYYSQGVYLKIANCLRQLFGGIPFSIGDVIYIVIVLYFGIKIYRHKWALKTSIKTIAITLLAASSVVYFLFYVFWGLNYFRTPLHKRLNISDSYTTQQLIELTEVLVTKSNQIQFELSGNPDDEIKIPYATEVIYTKISNTYDALYLRLAPADSIKLPFKYNYKSVKSSMLSLPLSYMGFSGYLNPFTNEAQINNNIPDFRIPTVSAHEIAHQLGYSAENEANFLAYLATSQSSDRYFQYAGYTFALQHCLNELYRRDKKQYANQLDTLHPGVLKNFNAVKAFWDSYNNPLEPLLKLFYSNFLKANNQKEGIKSYSYVVALIVNTTDIQDLKDN